MISTVIFDMDGVIVNTEPLHYEVSLVQFKTLGIEVPPLLYGTFTGNSNKNIYQKLKDSFKLSHSIDELLAEKNKLFINAFHGDETVALLPGVRELIIDLYDNGMELIVASSSEHEIIDLVFARFGLGQYFTHKVSGQDFVNSKPDPAIFRKAVELSKSETKNCIVIEDSANGIAAAKAAGLYCIGYKSTFAEGQDQSKADRIIYDFSELNFENISKINY